MGVAYLLGRTSGALASFCKAFTASLVPRTDAEVRLVDQQLSIARAATWQYVFVLPAAAVFIAAANAQWVALSHVVLWPLAVLVFCAGTDLYYRKLLGRSDHSAADVRRRALVYTAMTFVHTLL